MHCPKAILLLFFVITFLANTPALNAQTVKASLRLGESVERTISRGQTHTFSVSLNKDQFLQAVVDQRGIDVVVRVFSPDGKSLGEFDSPNGASGPEEVSIISQASGLFRIDVSPLEQQGNPASGRYEIKILDLRPATRDELDTAKNREAAKLKGLALLTEVADSLQLIRLPETRVRAQIQTSQLLWASDEKRARKLMDEAIEGANQYLSNLDPDDQNYSQGYQTAMQLRNEVLMALTSHDPERALSFIRSTRIPVDPNAGQPSDQQNQEAQFELSVATQIAVKDPKRALQIAQESLKKGYSNNLVDTLNQLYATDPDSAVKLAGEMAAKLQDENLLKNQMAGNAIINLLRASATQEANNLAAASGDAPKPPLLSEKQYRDLFGKALSAAVAYAPPPSNYYSVERSSAQNILNSLKSMTAEMEKYAPGKAAVVEKALTQLNTPPDPQSRLMYQYQEAINNGSVAAALEAAANVPQEMRDQVYQQVAMKAAMSGDLALAKQILNEHVSNPFHRQQALKNLEQQAIYSAFNNGKIEDALRNVNNIRSPKERAMMLIQIVNQMGRNQKRAILLDLLEQARVLIASSGRAEDQEQMNALFEIAGAYFRLEPKRGFEILEPLVDQFNEMSAAAIVLNGFGQQFFQDGELMMQNGNSIGAIANQLMTNLGNSAVSDFDRAKAAADRVQRLEVRLTIYLGIAQHAISEEANEGVRISSNTRRLHGAAMISIDRSGRR
jgi:uncharacterized protein YpiB (UPF0302 family)